MVCYNYFIYKYYFSGFGIVFHRPTTIVGYFCWVGGTKSFTYTKQSGDRGGIRRNETEHKNYQTKNVRLTWQK